jgi:hypothetical protein
MKALLISLLGLVAWLFFRAARAPLTPPGTTTIDAMSLEEACRILGVNATATSEEIKHAHHRLMKTTHPDHGGSTYFAARANLARDTLLALKK